MPIIKVINNASIARSKHINIMKTEESEAVSAVQFSSNFAFEVYHNSTPLPAISPIISNRLQLRKYRSLLSNNDLKQNHITTNANVLPIVWVAKATLKDAFANFIVIQFSWIKSNSMKATYR